MRVRRPTDAAGDFSGPVADFERFCAQPPAADWERELGRLLDLANLADFQLLLNLFQNRNGYPFDYLMHETLVHDADRGQFFLVPWDFELTLHPAWSWEWLRSGLMERLERETPAYADRLAARWRELRTQGGVTPEALAARVDEAAAPLRGYVEWDYRRWSYGPDAGWEASLADLKERLRDSVARMDERLERPSPAARENAVAP